MYHPQLRTDWSALHTKLASCMFALQRGAAAIGTAFESAPSGHMNENDIIPYTGHASRTSTPTWQVAMEKRAPCLRIYRGCPGPNCMPSFRRGQSHLLSRPIHFSRFPGWQRWCMRWAGGARHCHSGLGGPCGPQIIVPQHPRLQ